LGQHPLRRQTHPDPVREKIYFQGFFLANLYPDCSIEDLLCGDGVNHRYGVYYRTRFKSIGISDVLLKEREIIRPVQAVLSMLCGGDQPDNLLHSKTGHCSNHCADVVFLRKVPDKYDIIPCISSRDGLRDAGICLTSVPNIFIRPRIYLHQA
jgi:hypothetical protein